MIGALVFGIFFSAMVHFGNFFHAENPKQGGALLGGIIAALTGAFFAYDGWVNITFVAGEIKQPQRNIPKSLFTGVIDLYHCLYIGQPGLSLCIAG